MNILYKIPFLFFILFIILSCKPEEELKQKESLNVSFAVSETKGVQANDDNVSVYPNPFQHRAFISIHTTGSKHVTVRVSDENGKFKVIKQENIDNANIALDFINAKGGYFVAEVLVDGKLYKLNLFRVK